MATIKVRCEACGQSYRIADALVGNKAVCKKCRAVFSVRAVGEQPAGSDDEYRLADDPLQDRSARPNDAFWGTALPAPHATGATACLSAPPGAPTSRGTECPLCHAQVKAGQTLCDACARRVGKEYLRDEDQEPWLKRYLPAMIVLAVLFAVALGLTAAFAGLPGVLGLLVGLAIFAAVWLGYALLFWLSCRIFKEEMSIVEAAGILLLALLVSGTVTLFTMFVIGSLAVAVGERIGAPAWFAFYRFLAAAGVCSWRMEIDFLKALGICLLYQAMALPIDGLLLLVWAR